MYILDYMNNKQLTKGITMTTYKSAQNNIMPNTTIINSYKRILDINKVDVSFRDLQDNDNQFEIMKFILNCLSDEQIKDTKKLIKVWKQYEKKQSN